MTKLHFITCYQRAKADGFHHFAAAIAALYLKEFGKPIPQ